MEFCNPQPALIFLDLLSEFSMLLQNALIFLLMEALELPLQKITILSMDEHFLNRSMELDVEIACWRRSPF